MNNETIRILADQAAVRGKRNPQWRVQLKAHREGLLIGPETKGMGAREIIWRALRINYGITPKSRTKGEGLEKWFK